jgi:hypothetical protein
MLALALLADHFGEIPTSDDYSSGWETERSQLKCIRYGQRFLGVVAGLPGEASWTISSDHLRDWLATLDQQTSG